MTDLLEYQDIIHYNPDQTVAYRLRVDVRTGEIVDPPTMESLALAAHKHRHAVEQREKWEDLRERLSGWLANNLPEKTMSFPGIKVTRVEGDTHPFSPSQFADWVAATELGEDEWAYILAHFNPPVKGKPPTERMAQAIANARGTVPKKPTVLTTRIPEDMQ